MAQPGYSKPRASLRSQILLGTFRNYTHVKAFEIAAKRHPKLIAPVESNHQGALRGHKYEYPWLCRRPPNAGQAETICMASDSDKFVGALQLAHEYSGVRVKSICSHGRWIFCIFAQVRIHLSFHFDWRLESREKIPNFRKGDKEAFYSTLGAELLRL